MKVKSAHETAGIGHGHRYLGHFAKAANINRGHNSSGKIDPYETGAPANKLKGDEPTLSAMDEKLSSVKAADRYEEIGRQLEARKEIDRQVEDFAQKKRKEFRYRGL